MVSTNGDSASICRFTRETDAREVIIGTESGIIHRLKKENPGKTFIPASSRAVCPNMKKITLEKVLRALRDMAPQITVPEPIRLRAKRAVDLMLEAV